MGRHTLIDLAKRSGNAVSVGIVEAMSQQNAFWNLVPVRQIQGVMYKYGQRTGLPTMNYRGVNAGTTASNSTVRDIIVECKPMFGYSEVDKFLADGYKDGASAYRLMEDRGFLAAGANTFNSKAYYGNSSVTAPEIDGIGTVLGTLAAGAVSATGAGAGVQSSMYFWSFNDAVGTTGRLPGVEVPVANGLLPQATDLGVQLVFETGSTTKKFPAYSTMYEFAPGLAIYDSRSVGRLANISASSLPTVALINQVITSMFPYSCDLITCSKTVYNYVQTLKGSSAFQQTAPYESNDIFKRATHFNGIPIMIDESITQTEAVVS